MPIAQLLELWKKIEVEPMEIEVSGEENRLSRRSWETLTHHGRGVCRPWPGQETHSRVAEAWVLNV